MQKHANLADLVKSFPTNIFLQNLASIQKRTSPIKFAHLAEKSEKLSKVQYRTFQLRLPRPLRDAVLPVPARRLLDSLLGHVRMGARLCFFADSEVERILFKVLTSFLLKYLSTSKLFLTFRKLFKI